MLNVTFDASKLEAWAKELSTRGLRNAIRRAVDQSARAARKTTIPIIAADIGVSKARIKAATPKVIGTTAAKLSASWTVSKMRIGILNTVGAKIGKTGLYASTHRVTGGGSASLNLKRAFIISANGGRFVAVRKPGASRLPVKGIYAETPSTALGQDNAAARTTWQREANKELSTRLPVEIAKQLRAEGLSAATVDTSD